MHAGAPQTREPQKRETGGARARARARGGARGFFQRGTGTAGWTERYLFVDGQEEGFDRLVAGEDDEHARVRLVRQLHVDLVPEVRHAWYSGRRDLIESMGFSTGINLDGLLDLRHQLADWLPDETLSGRLGVAGPARTFQSLN